MFVFRCPVKDTTPIKKKNIKRGYVDSQDFSVFSNGHLGEDGKVLGADLPYFEEFFEGLIENGVVP